MTDTTPYETMKISLPSDLASYVRRAAGREDRTISGLIRRLVAEAARLEAPPAAPKNVLQHVPATSEGIAEGKARLAALEQRRDAIVARSRRGLHEPTPATDDIEFRELIGHIDWLRAEIAMSEKFVGDVR
jgi:hypothetical protein